MNGVPLPESVRISERDMQRGQEIENTYEKPIAAWTIEHGTNQKDFTPPQYWRFHLWEATGWSVDDAVLLGRYQFVRWQIRTGLLGQGDDVRAARP